MIRSVLPSIPLPPPAGAHLTLGPGQVTIETYKDLVDRCAKKRLNFPIANGSPFHARILISKLFEIAEKEVQIVSGTLRDKTPTGIDIYGFAEVIDQARHFLADPYTHLSVTVQEGTVDEGNENRFLAELVNDPNRNGIIELIVPQPGALDITVPHFMIADNSGYRLETGADAAIKSDAVDEAGMPLVAIANFGDPDTGAGLGAYYRELIDSFEPMGVLKQRYVFSPGEKFKL